MSFMFDKVKDALHDVKDKIDKKDKDKENAKPPATPSDKPQDQSQDQPLKKLGRQIHSHTHHAGKCSDGDSHHLHRFQSFAPQREGNNAKWYVDGASYFWAVSEALENARESVWILDWWLSPEVYMRRPPAKNEQYRLDRLLFAAANRGVQVNIIVYKEVTQALTLSSSHTKHWLEDNDKTGNIRVLRHPDHLPDRQTLASSFWSSIKDSGINAAKLSKLPGDFVKGIYGMNEDSILYWAHHEKLCLVDGKIAFMGGLDLCYGRWDTNQHSIADAHPTDLNEIVFPGQDYNNARIMDFSDVQHWQNNKLDRTKNSRMGWSDVSICLQGPIVTDLRAHFSQRWNFIYFEKYDVRKDSRYQPIDYKPSRTGIIGHPYQQAAPGEPVEGEGQYHHFRERMHEQFEHGRQRLEEHREHLRKWAYTEPDDAPTNPPMGGVQIQLMRSCTKWSHGVPLEHSIANAYIETIRDSKHFVYIENQFFITATCKEQAPVENLIGAAIVERIVRAARDNENYHIIVNIPSVPGFAGDLKADAALGTRAIMEFQYNSINRGGHSIMEKIAQQGVDPMKYIRFYNLRNYDRINASKIMQEVEKKAGVKYDDARKGYDKKFAQTVDAEHYGAEHTKPNSGVNSFHKYQEAAQASLQGSSEKTMSSGNYDSVAQCYMLNGQDLRSLPWEGDPDSELDAFVSEELYIHSKILIADDRVVICGSANLNDRSQLGSHDSEIAVLVEDPQEIDSYMAGQPWKATRFAASLRRQIFRKHLGLLPPQDFSRPSANFLPIGEPNEYDWGSREDAAVADPSSEAFHALWKTTAANNTAAFGRVFHAVPSDNVQNWKQYDEYFEKYFKPKDEKSVNVKWGHVVKEEFSPGQQGLDEVKEILSRVKGNLVEMPLLFLREEDIAKEGLSLNALTEVVYT